MTEDGLPRTSIVGGLAAFLFVGALVWPLAAIWLDATALDRDAAFHRAPRSLATFHHGLGIVWPVVAAVALSGAGIAGATWRWHVGRLVTTRNLAKSLPFGWYALLVGAHLSPVGWLAILLGGLVLVPAAGFAGNRAMSTPDDPPRPTLKLGVAIWSGWLAWYAVASTVTLAGLLGLAYLVAAPAAAIVPNLDVLAAWAKLDPEGAAGFTQNLLFLRWAAFLGLWGWLAASTVLCCGFLPGWLLDRAWAAVPPDRSAPVKPEA
jgi:hypothetical protein